MARKTQRTKKTSRSLAEQARQLEKVNLLAVEKKWPEVIEEAQKLLNSSSFEPEPHTILLGFLATAHAGRHDYRQAYKVFTEILTIRPDDAEILFYRGLVAKYTDRLGQAVRDLEAALQLLEEQKNDKLAHEVQKELKKHRKYALKAARKRGPNFTLYQLIEQEEMYQAAFELTTAKKWVEAERLFRGVIEMAEKDFDARPWCNLGTCLAQQKRYDEAELAWKRAVKINRFYTLARNYLRTLPAMRRGENIPIGRYVEVYEGDTPEMKMIVDEEE